jgi:hypothetical protein
VGASIKIHEDTTNKLFSHNTNEEGKCKVLTSSLATGKIMIEHEDYY